jgi:mRNA interferase MazF
MRRGEVRWYTFPKPDKKRPIVILTRNSIIGYINEITIAPITSTIRDIPSEVVLSNDNGMPHECAVNCDHLQTVAKNRIGGIITQLSAGKMKEVGNAIKFAIDL